MYNYEKRKLNFQLVPSTSWYTNLRSILPNWSEISNKVRQLGKCEICGTEYDIKDLEAHEVWEYDDNTHKQSLGKIICVCKECHNTIHIGHAQVIHKEKEALAHYQKINGLDKNETLLDEAEAFAIWSERSEYQWTVDEKQLKARVKSQLGIECDFDSAIDGKFYAFVTYEDKDKAKELGAKWDAFRRMWYFNDKESRDNWNKQNSKTQR